MKINYLYLDDEPTDEVEAYIRRVEAHSSDLKIELRAPKQFTKQMDLIQGRQSQTTIDSGFFHGLILDFRLSEQADWSVESDAHKAGYNAPTLAQEIRNRATDLQIHSFPIALWSTDDKLNNSYWKDDTSHDLFDARFIKQRLIDDNEYAKATAEKLISLVSGYKDILANSSTDTERPNRLLRIEGYPGLLDPRMDAYFIEGIVENPVHEQARFLISQLLEIPNSALISKQILAARLGIDISEGKSSGFDQLVNAHFIEAAYKGPFNFGWPCWWQPLIDQIWLSLPNNPGSLIDHSAEQRVKFLKTCFGIDELEAASPIEHAEYDCFWTICQATLRPLDLRDGFVVNRPLSYSWQDPLYVSFYALVEEITDEKRISLDPLEKSRFQRVKKRLLRR